MSFCHNPQSFVSEVVSTRRNKTTREEEASRATIRGQEKKGEYEGEDYQKQKTSRPYTHFS
jgi:hypothetical protein